MLPLFIICIPMLLTDRLITLQLFLSIACVALVAAFREIRYRINKIIIPYTVGILEPIILQREPTYGLVYITTRAWTFTYFFEKKDMSNTHILGTTYPKSYDSPLIPKNVFDKKKFLSSPLKAFVDPENSDNNCPYIDGFIQKYRMTNIPA